jgi:hypothetical protein
MSARTAGTLRPGSIAVVYGTRPEIIKLARIIHLLGDRAFTICSGQHFDRNLAGDLVDELELGSPGLTLSVGGQRRGQQIAGVVQRLEEQFIRARPAAVVVQGDTNTTVGAALAANAAEIPLAHVEAGLRSFDRRMPEEHNRVVADHLADLCCAPTETSRQNLLAEGVPEERVAVTGNTVVDVATRLLWDRRRRVALLREMELQPRRFVLATFHRPENVDDATRLRSILGEVAAIGVTVLLTPAPAHPSPNRAPWPGAAARRRPGGPVAGLRPLPEPGCRERLDHLRQWRRPGGGERGQATGHRRPALHRAAGGTRLVRDAGPVAREALVGGHGLARGRPRAPSGAGLAGVPLWGRTRLGAVGPGDPRVATGDA